MKIVVSSLAVIALGAVHVFAADPSPSSSAPKKKSQVQNTSAGNEVTGKHAPGLFRAETQATADPNAEQTPKTQTERTVVSGGVLNGKAISKPQPPYPPIAKGSGASGTVKVQVVVDENGRVVSAKAISGHRLLRDAAMKAAQQARFSPTLLSGQPVKVSGLVTYDFVRQ